MRVLRANARGKDDVDPTLVSRYHKLGKTTSASRNLEENIISEKSVKGQDHLDLIEADRNYMEKQMETGKFESAQLDFLAERNE